MKSITAGELPGIPANDRPATAPAGGVVGRQTRLIRNLIWLYIILWLIEGGLRRWVLPGLSSPLLLIRDPLIIAIYWLSVSNNLFPVTGFVVWGAVLAVLSFVNAMVMGHGNIFVALYGVRCDFIHVPLIFIIGRVLRESNILALAKVAVWVAVPYTALLVAQFYMLPDAWVNRGVGGTEADLMSGALGHFRPPGTFSFITGPSQLYPLFAACWFALLLARKLPVWTMIASGAAILVAIPISVSRTLFLSVAIVAVTGASALFAGGRFSMKLVVQFALAVVVISVLANQSQAFHDGMEAFKARWDEATTEQGGFKEAIVDRVLNDLFGAFEGGIKSSGLGTGYSTNVGQKALKGEVGFGASEAEWGRLLYDNGFVLGSLLIGYRIAIACWIVLASFRAWKRGSTLSLLFASACFVIVLNGQWGQPTTLGSAIIGAGLALAAASNRRRGGSKVRPES